jgi:hypothetical protein
VSLRKYNWSRIIAGAAIAPFSAFITAPIAVVCTDVLIHGRIPELSGDLQNTMGGAFLFALGALMLMPIIGVPAYLIAVRLKIASIWTAALTGILVSGALIAVTGPPRIPFAAVASFIVLGFMSAIIGIVFWLLVPPISE